MSILDEAIEVQAKALREFGYPDVTADMVREAHRKFLAGEPMANVIEMFCQSAFEDHPDLFGAPEPTP